MRISDWSSDVCSSDLLHAQRELLLLQLDHVGLQLVGRLPAAFLAFHQRTVRVQKVVVTESLAAARRNASRAVASSTPSLSSILRPGRIGAQQNSPAPLPDKRQNMRHARDVDEL